MSEELQEALDRLQQQPEEVQHYVIGLVRDVLDWEEAGANEQRGQAQTDAQSQEQRL